MEMVWYISTLQRLSKEIAHRANDMDRALECNSDSRENRKAHIIEDLHLFLSKLNLYGTTTVVPGTYTLLYCIKFSTITRNGHGMEWGA